MVAIGISSHVFDIMPAELRAHSEVSLELNDGPALGVLPWTVRRSGAVGQFRQDLRPLSAPCDIRVQRSAYSIGTPRLLADMLGALGLGIGVRSVAGGGHNPAGKPDRRYHGLRGHEFKPFFQPTFDLRSSNSRV